MNRSTKHGESLFILSFMSLRFDLSSCVYYVPKKEISNSFWSLSICFFHAPSSSCSPHTSTQFRCCETFQVLNNNDSEIHTVAVYYIRINAHTHSTSTTTEGIDNTSRSISCMYRHWIPQFDQFIDSDLLALLLLQRCWLLIQLIRMGICTGDFQITCTSKIWLSM